MPRVHPADDLERHYRECVFPNREVWLSGNPVDGYIALDLDEAMVTSLFVGPKGRGIGKHLLDHAKTRLSHMTLWTFLANTKARRFYAREGFREVARSDGDNEERLPDILLHWEAA